MFDTFRITATQIVILFLIMSVGFILGKKGVFSGVTRASVIYILFNVVIPCMVICSVQTDYTSERAIGLCVTAMAITMYYLLAIFISRIITKHHKGERIGMVTRRMCMIYANCGFFGLPLLSVLSPILGQDVLFYGAIIVGVSNVFTFTQGIMMFGEKLTFKGVAKKLLSPAVLSVFIGLALFLLQIRLPSIILTPMTYLSSMNTPLAMLVIGGILSNAKHSEIVRDKRILMPLCARNIFFPLVFLGLSYIITLVVGYSLPVLGICFVIVACPCAANCVMFADIYGGDNTLAAGIFTASTVLSAFSIPLLVMFADAIGVI